VRVLAGAPPDDEHRGGGRVDGGIVNGGVLPKEVPKLLWSPGHIRLGASCFHCSSQIDSDSTVPQLV
jgi:hypothetical protein